MTKRANEILTILMQEQRCEVAHLAKRLAVSQVTIRKDLDDLERKGIIERTHGFATLRSRDTTSGRIAYHYDVKQKIAACAAQQVKDGDMIMMESGSCCALLADALAETKKDLQIITNSAFIADFIRNKCNFQILLLGGIYDHDAQIMVGPMIRQCVQNFCVNQFFIGTDGYSRKSGFTNRDQLRAQAVRDMASQAEKVIVISESEKFAKHGTVPLGIQDRITTVITDQRIDDTAIQDLRQDGIQVIKADQANG